MQEHLEIKGSVDLPMLARLWSVISGYDISTFTVGKMLSSIHLATAVAPAPEIRIPIALPQAPNNFPPCQASIAKLMMAGKYIKPGVLAKMAEGTKCLEKPVVLAKGTKQMEPSPNGGCSVCGKKSKTSMCIACQKARALDARVRYRVKHGISLDVPAQERSQSDFGA